MVGIAVEDPVVIGRPPEKKRHVARALRERIVAGQLAPGARLPSQQQLVHRFGVSGMTVQSSVRELVREGFVTTRRGKGMFVAATQPHFTNYVLLIPGSATIGGVGHSQFWRALRAEAEAIQTAGRIKLTTLTGVDVGETSEAVQRRLATDVREHRVAGLIFAAFFSRVMDSPLITEPRIPRAAISEHSMPGVGSVYPDLHSFIDQALDRLAAEGCRRIGMVGLADWGRRAQYFSAGCRRRGLTTAPLWQVTLAMEQGEGVTRCVELLLRRPAAQRPDGLVITDDNLVPAVTAGVAAAVSGAGRRLSIVAHTNLGYPTPSAVPVARLGYSARELLERCVTVVEQQRRAAAFPALQLVPARWATEEGSPA